MKRFIIYLYILCVGCNTNVKDEDSENKIIKIQANSNKVSVNTICIERLSFQKQIIGNGNIKAVEKSDLRFKIDERLSHLNVKNGQKVSKGQVLASLDNGLLKNQLQKAHIEFEKAENKLHEEKIDFGIGDKTNSEISPSVLKNLQIRSGYLEAENSLKSAQLLYNQTFLKAPFNGVVANIENNVGNYISSSEVFCTIINPNQLEVFFSILESDLGFIFLNQDINISSYTNSDKKYKASITEINPLVSENGLVKVKAKVNDIDTFLLEGMDVKVLINFPIENAVVIPKEALVLRSNKEVVFTAENNMAKWNYVEILDENSTTYAIKNGLKIGDTIIVSNNMNLSHDAHINHTFISQKYNNN